ncbi:MAG: hypothetical protein ACE5GW_05260 [Planctomycetota bacterium]
MGLFIGIVFLALGPISAAALPFLLRRPPYDELPRRIFASLVRRRSTGGGYPLAILQGPESGLVGGRFLLALQSGTLFLSVVIAFSIFDAEPGASIESIGSLIFATGAGILGGVLLLGGGTAILYGWRAYHSEKALSQVGIAGSWRSAGGDGLPFRHEILDTLNGERTLDAMGSDGLEILRALSHPAHPALDAPHPALRGVHVRLLLLAPRSQRIDPERQRRSCAEEAISRLGLSPQDHWRFLEETLQTRSRWVEKYGTSMEIRFLEGRPLYRTFLTSKRAWLRPWVSDGHLWLELRRRGRAPHFLGSLRDHFVNAWHEASQELSFSLTTRTPEGHGATVASGPTGSVFVHTQPKKKSPPRPPSARSAGA